MPDQREKAARLRLLHGGPRILVLPNAWDAASARLFEQAGFEAIATTSAGIANAQGYPDGQRIPRAEMLDVVRRIAAAVSAPVTADMEAGYGDAEETARGVITAGAVGLNFEDAEGPRLLDMDGQVERIRAIRRVADAAGVPLVINARTDVYLAQWGEPAARFDEAVRRANAYRDAGADCLFIPGARDADLIGRLVRAIRGPINILAGAGVPPAADLERLGVARVSVGSGPLRACLGLVRRIAGELRKYGTYGAFTEGALSYEEANRLME